MAKILVSGASIAGPTLAFWLCKSGHTVTVVERAPAVRTGGYAIDIRGAALEVVERMDLLPTLRARATDTLSNAFVDERGRPVATFDRGFGVIDPGDVEILRGELASLLYERTRPYTRYLFDDSITALTEDAHGVDVTFLHHPSERFDLVLGADGLHSQVRALRFGPEAPLLRHLGGAIAIFTAPNHLGLERAQWMLMAPGRVASIKSDHGNRTVKVTLIFTCAERDWDRDDLGQRRLATAAFAGLQGDFMRPILDAMQTADDFYADLSSQVRMPAWHLGRMALVGDAAFAPSAMTGQGTSLALIGAYLLADALRDTDGHADAIALAFGRYQAGLRRFVERNQDVAQDAAKSFAPRSSLGAWLRNFNLRLLPYMPWRRAIINMMMRDIARAAADLSLDGEPRPTAATTT